MNAYYKQLFVVITFITIFLGFENKAFSSHFKGGNMTWEVVNGDTVKITITSVWAHHLVSSPNPSSITVQLTELTNNELPQSGDFVTRIQTYQGIVPNDGNTHRVSYSSCCRVGGLSNPGGGNNFTIYTDINLSNSNSHSPISTVPNIVKVPINDPAATFQVPASDLDGDVLTYRMATPSEINGNQPIGMSISNSGLVTVNTTLPDYQVNQLYYAAVVISDGVSEVLIDFQLEITAYSAPPVFDYSITPANNHQYTITSGDTLRFDIQAYDTDGNMKSLVLTGNPVGSQFSPLHTTEDSIIRAQFLWVPTAHDDGLNVINFVAEDSVGTQSTSSVSILVSSNIVEDCTSQVKRNGKNNGFEWIQSVEIGDDIHNNSGKGEQPVMEYSSEKLHATPSEEIEIALTPGYTSREYTEYWRIWIDWNNDGDFGDSDEFLFEGKGKGEVTGHFEIPSDVINGEYKIKVAMSWKEYAPYCGNFESGEIEYYSIEITGTQNPPSPNTPHSH
ncbi:MAG: GEVED domain-containing protein [Flavobacteriales bacterium]